MILVDIGTVPASNCNFNIESIYYVCRISIEYFTSEYVKTFNQTAHKSFAYEHWKNNDTDIDDKTGKF